MKSVAAALFLLVLAAGCGDDSKDDSSKEPERKTASSTEDFCTAISKFADAAAGDDWAAVQQAADDLESAGLPEDAPDEAGKGYDVVLELVGKYESNAEVEKNITDTQDNQVEDLLTYTQTACAEQGSSPSPSPSE
ncbi:MAG: hypothetical protein ABWX84_15360 [Nocardioides sp.]